MTVDISKFFQFKFWDKVLYLDNQDVYPLSNERPGYFVGFADNCGDALTFKIYDDQTHRIVQVSVVRHYNDNNRVQFDPQLTDREMLLTYPADYQKAKIEDIQKDPDNLPKWDEIEEQISFEVPVKTPKKINNFILENDTSGKESPKDSLPPEDITIKDAPQKNCKKRGEIGKITSDLSNHWILNKKS